MPSSTYLLWMSLVPALLGCGAAQNQPRLTMVSTADSSATGAASRGELAFERAPSTRRVIAAADVVLSSNEFSDAEEAVPLLVEEFEGYVTTAVIHSRSREQRTAEWTVRIPADRFSQFLAKLKKLGVAENCEIKSQDVSEEYVDLEARLVTKQKLEERLLELMKAKSEKLADVFDFERQVFAVREEIERLQGRLRLLANQTEYSTAKILLREQNSYVPPESPSSGDRIASAWTISRTRLVEAGTQTVIATINVAPWLLVVGPLLWAAFHVALRVSRRRRIA